jgi:hypothetical protein
MVGFGDIKPFIALPSCAKTTAEQYQQPTVTDSLTSLMWTKNADKAGGRIYCDKALANSSACSSGGYTNWAASRFKGVGRPR